MFGKRKGAPRSGSGWGGSGRWSGSIGRECGCRQASRMGREIFAQEAGAGRRRMRTWQSSILIRIPSGKTRIGKGIMPHFVAPFARKCLSSAPLSTKATGAVLGVESPPDASEEAGRLVAGRAWNGPTQIRTLPECVATLLTPQSAAARHAPQPAPGCPSGLRSKPSVPLFARDLRPASSTTSCCAESSAAPSPRSSGCPPSQSAEPPN